MFTTLTTLDLLRRRQSVARSSNLKLSLSARVETMAVTKFARLQQTEVTENLGPMGWGSFWGRFKQPIYTG